MSRWFFSCAVNYRSYSVFETSQYSEDQGYSTKREAVVAGINHCMLEMKTSSSALDYHTQRLIDYSRELAKLEGMRDEAATDSTT
jgi:hypothetical protein